jgi:hypothetical protein
MRSRSAFQAIKSYQTDHYEKGKALMWQPIGNTEAVTTEEGEKKSVHRSFNRD